MQYCEALRHAEFNHILGGSYYLFMNIIFVSKTKMCKYILLYDIKNHKMFFFFIIM